jgi:uncharacterized protein
MRKVFLFLALSGMLQLSAQPVSQNGLAVIAKGGKDRVQLRWAPSSWNLWKSGTAFGYRIDRVRFEASLASQPDSVKFRGAEVLAAAVLPWQQGDPRWKDLVAKNKSGAFLFSSLYPAQPPKPGEKNEMALAMLMKSCDLDKQLAQAHGIYFADSSVQQNQTYLYRVSLVKAGKTMLAATVTVTTGMPASPETISTLKARFADKRAVLSFVTLASKDYAGYWIERSEDSLNYKTVNKVPFIRATTKHDKDKAESTYGDSLPQNNKRYYYRVRGITCFGETGPASNVVSGTGRPAFKEFPVVDSALLIKNAAVKLVFHLPAEPDVMSKNVCVMRSEKRTGAYTDISGALSPQTVIYLDNKPLETNYYKICAINQYGDTARSLAAYVKVLDETPPQVPAAPTGTIDSNGVVKISWAASTDADLLGYRVYRCNAPGEQPFELTRRILTVPAFNDTVTLKTLSPNVYYAVRAVDKVYNNSDYSPLCKLARPDKIAPVAVTFTKVTPNDSVIELAWNNSSSSDVHKYQLYRKENAGAWLKIAEWSAAAGKTSFADGGLSPENSYQYRIDAADASGNASRALSHNVVYKPLFYPRISPFTAHVDRAKRQIELQWITNNAAAYNFTLYKAKEGQPLTVFKTIDAGKSYYVDKELYPNNKYRYAIKATLKNGSETKLSEVIEAAF